MLKAVSSIPPILAASPNAGGLFCLIGGRSHLVRRESVTGLAADGGALYCVVQEGGANEIRRTTRDGSTVVRLADERLDLHDLCIDGEDFYAVYTETNEVVRLDGAFQVVERWRIPGEIDAVHLNCVATVEGRLLATLFGAFSGHREYKGRTKRAGQVIDVRTGEVLIRGLSQPHSILAVDGLLYLCNSEEGQLLVFRDYKRVEKVNFDRYTRGLAVDGRHVYVGLSASRNADIDHGGHAEVVVLDRGTLSEKIRIPLPCKEVYALMPLADEGLLQSVVAGLGEDLEASNRELGATRESMQELASKASSAQAAQAELGSALAGLNEARAQLEARLATLQDLVDEKAARVSELSEQIQQRDRWLGELRTHADALATARSELEARLQAAQVDTGNLCAELVVRNERIDALQLVVAENERQLADSRAHSAGQASRLAELEASVGALGRLRVDLEHRVATLEMEADGLRQQARARSEHNDDLQKLVGQCESRISTLTADLEHGAEELARTASRLSEADDRIEQDEARIARAQAEISRKESELTALKAALETARQEHVRQMKDMRSLLEVRHAELLQVINSNSWKLSAPLRWLRQLLGAARHRRRPAAYADMLKMPTLPTVSLDHGEATPVLHGLAHDGVDPGFGSPAEAPSASQAYLDNLFADEATKRAAEFVGPSDRPAPDLDELRAKLIAFYLPQFHPFPENDAWWGRGFTEWTNVTRAVPQFLGHHQPQLPGELGFYDLRLPDVIRQQVQLARQYGVHGFCFYYYWFAGHRLLERPLDLFLEDTDINFPFCLCWANENWTRRWDGRDNDILIAQEHTPENDLAFIRDLVPYLRDSRYIRVNGKPLVIVYRPSILPDCSETLMRWRDYCREVGIGEIFLAMVQFDVHDPREYGFDVALEFPPHKLATGLGAINHTLEIVNPDYRGHVVHYQSVIDRAKALPPPDYPLVRGVFPGWDNEARRPGQGYTFAFSTPERYGDWLNAAVRYAEDHPVEGERLVMVNAWNEWAEGAHLEPDRRFGYAFLQATRDVVTRSRAGSKVAVISHDAHPHGAQYLALNLVREFQRLGCQVEVVLLGPGPLREQFEASCVIHELYGDSGDTAEALAREMVGRGFEVVIANTAVSGTVARQFHEQGARIVSLIHELPGVIREYGLERELKDLVVSADRIVAPSHAVAEGLRGFVAGEALERSLRIRPQGLFTRSRYRSTPSNAAARAALRKKLQIPADSRVVLSVGYADKRKGVDLLVDAAGMIGRDREDVHFVWVGHHDVAMHGRLMQQLVGDGIADRFHFVGLDFDTDDYYAGADVYALPSREDPFPSVVLESLSVAIPVVAFRGTGGAADFLERHGGVVVKAFDVAKYAKAITSLIDDDAARVALGNAGREKVDADFSFRSYAMDLLAWGGLEVPRVSVVVPNYNYARYLRERLESIAAQTVPLYEIIVLDDCSSDDSVPMLRSLRSGIDPEPQILENSANSGSVFRQWLKGVERARGDFVWIAEADDLSSPGFLEALLEPMMGDPTVVMGYCQSKQIDESGAVIADNYLAYTAELSEDRWLNEYVVDGRDEVESSLAVKNVIPNVSAVVFRRKPLLDVLHAHVEDICKYRIAGDWIAYLRLLEKGRIAFVPDSLNLHRRHSNSVTLGSALRPHYDEVLSAQRAAAEQFDLGDDVRDHQKRYAGALARQFGLDAPESDAR